MFMKDQRLSGLRWLSLFLGAICLGFSQPFVHETFGEKPIDSSGLTGLFALVGWLPLLLTFKQSTSLKQIFWRSVFVITIQRSIVMYWLLVAMSVFGGIPLPIAIFFLLLLTGFLACFTAGGFVVGKIIADRFNWPLWLCLPTGFACMEFLLNFAPAGGYPWGNVGMSFVTIPILLQGAAVVGVYGLAWLGMMCNGFIASWFEEDAFERSGHRSFQIIIAVGLVTWLAYGLTQTYSPRKTHVDAAAQSETLSNQEQGNRVVRIGLLQGNIDQGIKNKVALYGSEIRDRFHALQNQAIDDGAELIVWPEASLPYRFSSEAKQLPAKKVNGWDESSTRVMPPALIGGLAKQTPAEARERNPHQKPSKYNTIFVTDSNLNILKRFDKSHLVPFGEFTPWPASWIAGKLVPGMLASGMLEDPINLTIGDDEVRVAGTVCYEGIFPEITRHYTKRGAELFVNVTNDGWYGVSSAATQHLYMYAMRAVESGRPVVRVANTGISGWVDIYGELHDLTPMYETLAHIVDVPIITRDTMYTTLGDVIPLTLLLLYWILWTWALLTKNGRWLRATHRQRKVSLLLVLLVALIFASHFIVQWSDPATAKRQMGAIALWWLAIANLEPTRRKRLAFLFSTLLVLGLTLASGTSNIVSSFTQGAPINMSAAWLLALLISSAILVGIVSKVIVPARS